MTDVKFVLPGPGTAAFLAVAAAAYASYALRDSPPLFFTLMALGLLSLAVGLVVEYAHVLTDLQRSGQAHEKQIHILLCLAYLLVILGIICLGVTVFLILLRGKP